MIDMGFDDDLSFILRALPVSQFKPDTDEAENPDNLIVDGIPKYRQTTMFSATMPPAVEKIAKQFLRRPIVVTIGEAGKAVGTVEQRIKMTTEERKQNLLLDILNDGWEPPIIVFVNQKKTADSLARVLERMGHHSITLHGGERIF